MLTSFSTSTLTIGARVQTTRVSDFADVFRHPGYREVEATPLETLAQRVVYEARLRRLDNELVLEPVNDAT